ncbi:MAG: sulfite exporter TauE/SafE family protein [Parcubacteria group bacterium]|nr:sulfite exporter TauE/SafE family protein [Parcubacteria group bacterium]
MEILYITLLTFIAATIGTITGFGTSTLMIPVLVIFFPPVEAIFLVAIIHWFGNVWKVALFRKGFDFRLIALFGLIGLATSYFGAYISLGANEQILLRILGAFLAGYALFLIFLGKFSAEGGPASLGPPSGGASPSAGRAGWKVPAGNMTALSGGALSGFFAGMFGIGGAIRSMFLLAFDLPKAVYIATAGAIGLLVDSTRIIAYFTGGATLPKELWYGLLLFIPISFAGAQIAKKIVDKIPQNKFRIVVAVFLFVIGAKLVLFP